MQREGKKRCTGIECRFRDRIAAALSLPVDESYILIERRTKWEEWIETICARVFQGAGFTRETREEGNALLAEIHIGRKRTNAVYRRGKETIHSARILRDFAFLSCFASLEFRLSFTEYEIPHYVCPLPNSPFPSFLTNVVLKPENLSNSCSVHLPSCPFLFCFHFRH